MPIIRPLTFLTLFLILTIVFSPWFFIGVIALSFDARARYSDYEKHKHLEWNPHLGSKFKRSWCSRGVAQCIWKDDAREFFRAKGYKPYHVLPEGFPMILLTTRFWKSVIGGLG